MNRTVAIIGASADRTKFGNQAVRAHLAAGWTVYPVNPKATEIEGLPAYASLALTPRPLTRISLYLPPALGLAVLLEIAAANAEQFFVNPGANSPELLAAAATIGLRPLLACSILAVDP
jgi:uncharacterized protein